MRQEQGPKIYKVGTREWQEYLNACWQPGAQGKKNPLSEIFSFHHFFGNRCFVIAGGPSLRGFDFSRLQKEYTIGINYINKIFHPWLLVSWDKVCYDWLKTQLIKSILVMVDVSNSNFDRVFYVRSAGDYGNPTEINRIYIGTHTGYAAINLALALGFSPIYLLGFDYGPDENGNYHVTDDWGHPGDIDQRLERFKKEVDRYPEYTKGQEIINLGPTSALEGFQKMNFNEIWR
jgi:hypothetical protein